MSQKEEIIQKLFNDEVLLHEELVYISYNLRESEKEPVSLPYNHEEKNIFSACGVTEDHAKQMNEKFGALIKEGNESSVSSLVEKVELISRLNPAYMRLVLIQAVQFSLEKNLRNQGPIKDLLDHLDKLKRKLDGDGDSDK